MKWLQLLCGKDSSLTAAQVRGACNVIPVHLYIAMPSASARSVCTERHHVFAIPGNPYPKH